VGLIFSLWLLRDAVPLYWSAVVSLAFALWIIVVAPTWTFQGHADMVGVGLQARLELANELRRTAAQVVGGLAVAIGVVLTWSELSLKRRGQLGTEFAAAIAYLDRPEASQQIRGLLALEELAAESDQTRRQVQQTLCAYIRASGMGAPKPQRNGEAAAVLDVQSVVDTLVRVSRRHIGEYHDESTFNLQHADLRRLSIVDLDLRGTNLAQATLEGSVLIRVNFARTNMDNVVLDGSRLDNCDFADSSMRDATLVRAKARACSFSGANMTRCRLEDSDLCATDFRKTNMTAVAAARAELDGALFDSAVLVRADFTLAHLWNTRWNDADLSLCLLTHSYLDKANFTGARNLSPLQLADAHYDRGTQFPPGVSIAPSKN
jgi:uncharacterized protein YjbI with pentapeptide repeats